MIKFERGKFGGIHTVEKNILNNIDVEDIIEFIKNLD